jgi:hypothetical protein
LIHHERKQGEPGIRQVKLLIAKNRNGACASLPFVFMEDTTNFEEREIDPPVGIETITSADKSKQRELL